MYIKKMTLKNYRNYLNTEILFNENLNIIIGPNNTGKTNLLKAISYLSPITEVKNDINDFNKNFLLGNLALCVRESPSIEIQFDIEHFLKLDVIESSLSRMKDFLWYDEQLEVDSETKNEYFINASILLKFELDPKFLKSYLDDMSSLRCHEYDDIYSVIEKYINNYKWNYYNAYSNELVKDKNKIYCMFDIDFIEAKRNIEKITDNTKAYINSKIKENAIDEHNLRKQISRNIKDEFNKVTEQINEDINSDQDKIGITNGKNLFVSSFDFNTPFGNYFKYELKNEEGNYILPLDNNGLGYNNLIYIRNIINQKGQSDYNLLLIEEPEAHLHPNMQYKLLKYLSELKEVKTEDNYRILKNQIFLTTHSPNITASTNLDDMILFDYSKNDLGLYDVVSTKIMNCFDLENFVGDKTDRSAEFQEEKIKNYFESILSKSRKHISKFLDVTRSDLLFSQKTIFVEGLSEKLLMPTFVKKIYNEDFLVNNYISVVELGGINFKYFFPLACKQKRKILCITDTDYQYFDINDKFKPLTKFHQCKINKINETKPKEYSKIKNIKVFTQENYGSTFEKELFLDNWHNKVTIRKLFEYVSENKLCFLTSLDFKYSIWKERIYANLKNDDINCQINSRTLNMVKELMADYDAAIIEDKTGVVEKLFFAELFYKYAKRSKGDFALILATDDDLEISVPEYIKKGLKWLFDYE